MDQYFGIKEVYNVVLKATDNIRLGKRQLEKGEPVTYFEHTQIATLNETVKPIAARGGRRNDPLVIWEDRQDVSFTLTCGVLSDIGFALLTNAKIMDESSPIYISKSEKIALDEYGKGYFAKEKPSIDKPIFCFLYENKLIQNKIHPVSIDYDEGSINFGEEYGYKEIMVDYCFLYNKQSSIYILERDRFNGMFELEGKYYRKGEQDGINHTTLFKLPKVRINSNLSIQMGELASPTISSFNIVATPQKTQYSQYSVAEFYNLEEDIG